MASTNRGGSPRELVDPFDHGGNVRSLPVGLDPAVDEIQKVQGWSETGKRLWDADTAAAVPLQVVLLGSAPLRVERGLGESLAAICWSRAAPE